MESPVWYPALVRLTPFIRKWAKQDADDVVQLAAIKLYTTYGEAVVEDSHIWQIVWSSLSNMFRRKNRQAFPSLAATDVVEDQKSCEFKSQVEAKLFVNELSQWVTEDEMSLLLLKLDHSHRQIAAMFGVTPSRIESRIRRIRDRIQNYSNRI